jgi:transcriptional regulator with XRE-family HTH domain
LRRKRRNLGIKTTLHADAEGRRWGRDVPGTATNRRLQALAAIGWTQADIAQRLGVTKSWVGQLRTAQRVTLATHRQVAALYEDLSCAPGGNIRAAKYAEKFGYAPPAAWDDETIGDPTARPAHNLRAVEDDDAYTDTYEEWLAERLIAAPGFQVPEAYRGRGGHADFHARMVDRLSELGRGAEEIGYQLGLAERSVVRLRNRAGSQRQAGVAA